MLGEMIKQKDAVGFAQILDAKPSSLSQLLDLATDVITNKLSEEDVKKRKDISGFLFGRYIDSVIGENSSVRTEQSMSTGATTTTSFYNIAESISNYLSHETLDLKSALSEKQLEGIAETIELEKLALEMELDSDSPAIETQLYIINNLAEQVDGILTEKKMVRLFGEVEGIVKEMLESPEDQNKDIEQINALLKDKGTPDFDKMSKLMEPLGRLIAHPQFEQKLGKILKEIGELNEIQNARKAFGQSSQERTEPSLLDITRSEPSKTQEASLDHIADEHITDSSPNPALESDAEREAREEEEKKRKLAKQDSTSTNNSYNHHSSSKNLDPNIAAAGLKLAGVLAIALGIGGPVGLILAGLFLIATKNIANGKTVTHINSDDRTQNIESPSSNEMMKQIFQSAQGISNQGGPTNMGKEATKVVESEKQELESHEETLDDRHTKLDKANTKQQEDRLSQKTSTNPKNHNHDQGR